MAGHTPGPWSWDGWRIRGNVTVNDEPYRRAANPKIGFFFTMCESSGWITRDEMDANARLIAAAPDLLEACEAVLEIIPSADAAPVKTRVRACEIADKVRAAIAKAKGE